MSVHIWAPEIHYVDNKWFIYFAGGDIEDYWAIRPYVLMCEGDDPLKDPWKEMGMLKRKRRVFIPGLFFGYDRV